MKTFAATAVLAPLLCFASAAGTIANKEHPISNVIDLIKSLKTQTLAEGRAEAATYDKFQIWCSDQISDLERAIYNEKKFININVEKGTGKNKEIVQLQKSIQEVRDHRNEVHASQEAAKQQRDVNHKRYKDVHETDVEAIEALEAGLAGIKDARGAMRETSDWRKTEEAKLENAEAAVESFIQVSDPSDDPEPARDVVREVRDAAGHVNEANAANNDAMAAVSRKMTGLITNLKEEDERKGYEETKAQNFFRLESDQRKDVLDKYMQIDQEKSGVLQTKIQEHAEFQNKVANLEADQKADEESLADVHQTCNLKADEWKERSTNRLNEEKAMDAAVQILEQVSGVRTKAPETKAAPENPVVSFLQIDKSNPKSEAVTLLRKTAHLSHSRSLAHLAQEIMAQSNDPAGFKEMNGMMQKLIFRLMGEQKDEDEHKAWCDSEISKSHTSQDDKEKQIQDLDLDIEDLKAKIQQLVEQIAEAEEFVRTLKEHQQEATEVRAENKRENTLAINDAVAAQQALINAIQVLESHYKESGEIRKENWEFMQMQAAAPVELPENPATWDSSYTGVADPDQQPGGIISVLKTIQKDFSQMEAETKAQEESDLQDFKEDMRKSDVEVARREEEIELKTQEKKRHADTLENRENMKKQTIRELESVEQYLKDLKPACVNGDSSYEDRKAARAKEIESIHEAQGILRDALKQPAAFLSRSVDKH